MTEQELQLLRDLTGARIACAMLYETISKEGDDVYSAELLLKLNRDATGPASSQVYFGARADACNPLKGS